MNFYLFLNMRFPAYFVFLNQIFHLPTSIYSNLHACTQMQILRKKTRLLFMTISQTAVRLHCTALLLIYCRPGPWSSSKGSWTMDRDPVVEMQLAEWASFRQLNSAMHLMAQEKKLYIDH